MSGFASMALRIFFANDIRLTYCNRSDVFSDSRDERNE